MRRRRPPAPARRCVHRPGPAPRAPPLRPCTGATRCAPMPCAPALRPCAAGRAPTLRCARTLRRRGYGHVHRRRRGTRSRGGLDHLGASRSASPRSWEGEHDGLRCHGSRGRAPVGTPVPARRSAYERRAPPAGVAIALHRPCRNCPRRSAGSLPGTARSRSRSSPDLTPGGATMLCFLVRRGFPVPHQEGKIFGSLRPPHPRQRQRDNIEVSR